MIEQIGITVLSRQEFNALSYEDRASNIYLVKEGDNYEMLSLFVGNAKQSDVMHLTEDTVLSINSPANPYRIDEKYKIKNKLYYYTQYIPVSGDIVKEAYRVVMWDGEQYLDMFTKESNVQICTSLPQTAKEDYVYINVHDNSIWVYHQGEYIQLVSKNIYASKEYVNTMYSNILYLIHEKLGV